MTSGLNRNFVFGIMPGFWKKAYQSAVRAAKSTIELQRLTPSCTTDGYELETPEPFFELSRCNNG
ncbi:hypothetical protein, partial [Microvirga vignae]|uniref:hypothetical protein n=1 Tax=Microvirga vignae TaxID=1225564 RepID=UPI001AEBF51C